MKTLALLLISLPAWAQLKITTSDIANATVGVSYSQVFAASGGTAPYTWAVTSGTLPAGLSLSSAGTLSGISTAKGWSNFFTVRVTDNVAATASLSYSMIVSPVFDTYGGIVGRTCSATGSFYTTKIGSRWWFCTPSGNLFQMMGMAAISADACTGSGACVDGTTGITNSYATIATARYGDVSTNWGCAQILRLKSWGFNTIGQQSTGAVDPVSNSCGTKLPAISQVQTIHASSNYNGYWGTNGAVKDMVYGLSPSYAGYRGAGVMDMFDPNLPTGFHTFAVALGYPTTWNSPWVIGTLGDDIDWLYTFGAGPDFPTVPDGHTSAHGGFMVAITSPMQVFNASARGTKQLYAQSTVYAKAAALDPVVPVCGVVWTCSWRDYIKKRYVTIGAVNTAWGSTYTTFDSSGTTATETIGTGDGSTTVFPFTLAHSPLSPLSVAVLKASTLIGGDCPWWSCGGTANTGLMESPDSTLVSGSPCSLPSLTSDSPGAPYPAATYYFGCVYTYNDGSYGVHGNFSSIALSAGQRPIVNSPATGGNTTGWKVYGACIMASGGASFGCYASGTSTNSIVFKLQASGLTLGSPWNLPNTGIDTGGAVEPAIPGMINYSTGVGTVTFSTAPTSGQSIQIRYVYNGWKSGGTGLMDESGLSAWVGTNETCLTTSTYTTNVCQGGIAPYDYPVPNANATFGADADLWIAQYSAKAHQIIRSEISATNPNAAFLSFDTLGAWGVPPRKEVLQGAAPYSSGAYPAWAPPAQDIGGCCAQKTYNYFDHWFGKPMFTATFIAATADSFLYPFYGNPGSDKGTQPLKGQFYLSDVSSLQNLITDQGNYNWVGLAHWGLLDFWTDGGGSTTRTNWGFVSLNDNPYDGKAAGSVVRTDAISGGNTTAEANIPVWQASHAYAADTTNGVYATVQPTSGTRYLLRQLSGSGTSSMSEPTWNTTTGGTTTDGSVTWTTLGAKASSVAFGDSVDYAKEANSMWFGLGAIAVTVSGLTNTQAILSFSSSAASCTIEVSELPDYSVLVHDIDASLFTGANTDTGNAQITGNRRVWVIGKTNSFGSALGVATALDGLNYSRALQATTEHFYRVTCGTDTGTGSFTTRNIPLGSTNVSNQAVDGSTGNWLYPTHSWTDRSQKVIDPNTGVLLGRTVMPRDIVTEFNTYLTVLSGAGAAWTTPNNVTVTGSSYAIYGGTAQAKITAPLNTGINRYDALNSFDFLSIKIDGLGNGSTSAVRTIQICLALISAPTTCISSVTDLVLPTSAGTVYYNQALTLGDFMGWAGANAKDVNTGNVDLLIWKKATSGSDTVSINNVQLYWGQSQMGGPSSSGFSDICSRLDSNGWTKCGIGGGLYAIHTTDGTVRFMGVANVLNTDVPGLKPDTPGASVCAPDTGVMWHATDPNIVYCNAVLSDNTPTIIEVTVDSTNAAVAQNARFAYPSVTILAPSGSDLVTLLSAYDSTLIPNMQCGVETTQGTTLLGVCRAGNQNSYAYTFAFDLANGTAIGSGGCGSIVNGRCQTSGVGITAANKVYSSPMSRWCTFHTLHAEGPVTTASYEVQTPGHGQPYGDSPYITKLAGGINTTDTTITLTSTYTSGAVSKSGTLTSSGTTVTGSGTTFLADTTVGDTITAGGQSRIVSAVNGNTSLTVSAAPSPDFTGQTWTNTWPAAPAFATGEPVSAAFPRFMDIARVGDYFTIGSEAVRITAKLSAMQWTVSRNCQVWIGGTCTGPGANHSISADVVSTCNCWDPINVAGAQYFWNWLADPHGTDTNVDDPTNAGNHPTVIVTAPNGFNGAHNASRGNFHISGGYDLMAVAGGVTTTPSLTLPSNYPIPETFYFGGKFSPNQGNTYQRHPSCTQAAWNAGYQYDFCTDAVPFVGGNGFVSSATPSTQVEGLVYKVGAPDPAASPDGLTLKYLPPITVCGKTAMQDISGPSSHITISTLNSFCYANATGECRTSMDTGGAASAGDYFVNCGVTPDFLYCTGTEAYNGTQDICVGNKSWDGNGSIQLGIRTPPDASTVINEGPKRARMLATVYAGPRTDLSGYPNMKVVEGANYMFHSATTNLGMEYLPLKNPGMPPVDSINRQTFIPVKVTLNTPPGRGIDNAIVKFGYDSNFQCTSRAEGCVAAASNAPYFFASETYSGVSCSTSCAITVPALPSRMLYTQYVYRNGSTVVSTGPVQVQAVP